MKITINWGKGKPNRPAKYGKGGKGAGTCGCGRGIPAGVTACPRCARAARTEGTTTRKAIPNGTHNCPDGKTRTTRQGKCPGPFC